jgi:hypothetical protein
MTECDVIGAGLSVGGHGEDDKVIAISRSESGAGQDFAYPGAAVAA